MRSICLHQTCVPKLERQLQQQGQKMRHLTTFTFISETSLGCIAIGALWSSPWPLMIKISFTSALLLLCITQDLRSVQLSLQAEQQLSIIDLGVRAIEQRQLGNEIPLFQDLYLEHLKQDTLKQKIAGNGSAYIVSFMAKYAIWLIGASVLHWLVFPEFTPTIIANWK